MLLTRPKAKMANASQGKAIVGTHDISYLVSWYKICKGFENKLEQTGNTYTFMELIKLLVGQLIWRNLNLHEISCQVCSFLQLW